MATGVSNFTLSSSGNNINFTVTWEGFNCLTGAVVRVRLIDATTNVGVATLEFSSNIGTTGTIASTFSNIYNGIFRASVLFICDGSLVSIYDSQEHTHSTSNEPIPSDPPAPPGSGPTGVGSNNVNANGNLNFCIGTDETGVSFSRLNQIFGRRSANSPNTQLSGGSNPSVMPSIFGFSTLPSNTVTPGKLRQNAVSELRGVCNYAAPNLYSVTLEWGVEQIIGTTRVREFKVVWVHEDSDTITDECPFDSSRVEIFTSVRVNNTYVGASTPSPYNVVVTHLNFSASTVTSQTTSRAANASAGTTTANRQINLNYRDRVYGVIQGQNSIVTPSSTFRMTMTADINDSTFHQLASINIPRISNAFPLVVERVVAGSGAYTYSYQNSLSGSGATSSVLSLSGVFTNTRSSSGTNSVTEATSTATGNRTVSVTPTPGTLYTTLVIIENGITIYNVTQTESQSTTVNFQAGSTYIINALSTTATQ